MVGKGSYGHPHGSPGHGHSHSHTDWLGTATPPARAPAGRSLPASPVHSREAAAAGAAHERSSTATFFSRLSAGLGLARHGSLGTEPGAPYEPLPAGEQGRGRRRTKGWGCVCRLQRRSR
jgi:hypothetical protein